MSCTLLYLTLFLLKDCLFLMFYYYIRTYVSLITYVLMGIFLLKYAHLKFDILSQIGLPKELWQFIESVFRIIDYKNFGFLAPWILLVLRSVWYLLIQISIFDCVVSFQSSLFFFCA